VGVPSEEIPTVYVESEDLWRMALAELTTPKVIGTAETPYALGVPEDETPNVKLEVDAP
jgi:hypothetical protein